RSDKASLEASGSTRKESHRSRGAPAHKATRTDISDSSVRTGSSTNPLKHTWPDWKADATMRLYVQKAGCLTGHQHTGIRLLFTLRFFSRAPHLARNFMRRTGNGLRNPTRS